VHVCVWASRQQLGGRASVWEGVHVGGQAGSPSWCVPMTCWQPWRTTWERSAVVVPHSELWCHAQSKRRVHTGCPCNPPRAPPSWSAERPPVPSCSAAVPNSLKNVINVPLHGYKSLCPWGVGRIDLTVAPPTPTSLVLLVHLRRVGSALRISLFACLCSPGQVVGHGLRAMLAVSWPHTVLRS